MARVSFSPFWKWVVLPQALKNGYRYPLCQHKKGTPKVFNNNETHRDVCNSEQMRSLKTKKYRTVNTLHSLRFSGHFPGEPALAGVYWSKGRWRWRWQLDYWSYKSCKAPIKSTPTNQHPVCYRPDALPVAQPTVSKHRREKYHIPWTCLP